MEGQVKVTATNPLNDLSNRKTLVETLVRAINRILFYQNRIQVTKTTKMTDRLFKVSHSVFKVKTLVSMVMKVKVTIRGVKVTRIFKVISSFLKITKAIFTTDKDLNLKVINIKDISRVQLIMVSMETIRVRVSMEFRVMTKDFIKWVWDTIQCTPITCSESAHRTLEEILWQYYSETTKQIDISTVMILGFQTERSGQTV